MAKDVTFRGAQLDPIQAALRRARQAELNGHGLSTRLLRARRKQFEQTWPEFQGVQVAKHHLDSYESQT